MVAGQRRFAALAGGALLIAYLAVAALLYETTAALWVHRPDPVPVAVGLLAVTLALLAYSRRREWAADERAVAVTGDPLALARALRKIQRAATPDVGLLTPLYVHGEDDGPLTRWLSTHPPMDERIERLLERARTARGDEVRAARRGPR